MVLLSDLLVVDNGARCIDCKSKSVREARWPFAVESSHTSSTHGDGVDCLLPVSGSALR
jgi:hypothetical protein